MDAAQHIVKLGPIAVELVDRTMLGLARDIAMFRRRCEQFVRGEPEAMLLVEFGEDDQKENLRRLDAAHELMGDLGFGWSKAGAKWGGVVEVLDAKLQAAIADVRTAGLNIMMSMKDEGKPVSFVEDCAVPLEHLAEYTAKLTAIFEKHGTRGTWYAHASVGCLHVRPVLNLRLDKDVRRCARSPRRRSPWCATTRARIPASTATASCARSSTNPCSAPRLVRAFEEVKDTFDPDGLFNPGKIVRAPKFDDRSLFRYGPGYRGDEITTVLDWSA